MNTARFLDTATILPNGEVLAAGGASGGTALASAELYNPAAGTWAVTGGMHAGRVSQTATLLSDGKVLVAGGGSATSSAELYNPATGTWTVTGNLHTNRGGETATLLNNGEVLVAGGTTSTGSAVASAELYNPATGKWALTGSLSTARDDHAATLLPDGDVLVAGGLAGLNSNPSGTISSILYNPATNSWTTTGALTAARDDQTANLLKNGQVLVAGGGDFVKHALTELASANLYTP